MVLIACTVSIEEFESMQMCAVTTDTDKKLVSILMWSYIKVLFSLRACVFSVRTYVQ